MSQHEFFARSNGVAEVNGFALRALTVVATEMTRPGNDNLIPTGPSEEEILEALLKAVCDPDRASFDRAVSHLLGGGGSTLEEIANRHVPTVARALGQAWVDDQMEFATVSIACARLQGYLRHKGLDWCDKASLATLPTSTVLLVVPEFEQHTLGATLLAGQLRAQGVWVTLELNVPADAIQRLASVRQYDAVLISSSRNQTLGLLRSFVSKARKSGAKIPIVIGGNLLDQSPDVLKATGADFTANSWQGALDVVGRKTKTRSADPVGCRGAGMSMAAFKEEPRL